MFECKHGKASPSHCIECRKEMDVECSTKRDLELLAKLRSDPHIDRALNGLSRLSGAAREQGDPIQYTYNKAWPLLRGDQGG